MCGKYFKKKQKIREHFETEWTSKIPSQRLNKFWYILQNQKVYLMNSFPSSPTYSVKSLRSTAKVSHPILPEWDLKIVVAKWTFIYTINFLLSTFQCLLSSVCFPLSSFYCLRSSVYLHTVYWLMSSAQPFDFKCSPLQTCLILSVQLNVRTWMVSAAPSTWPRPFGKAMV